MATIRQLESANNYQAQAGGSDASGAYQFLDHTWATWAARAGYADEYPRAHLAPPHIQDDVAATYITAILAAHDDDIGAVPVTWYYPAALDNPDQLDTVPAPQASNTLTIRQYQARWLALYNDKRQAGNDASPSACGTSGNDQVVAF